MLPVAWKPPPSLGLSQPNHSHRQPLFISHPKRHPGLSGLGVLFAWFCLLFTMERHKSVTVKPGDFLWEQLGCPRAAVLGTGALSSLCGGSERGEEDKWGLRKPSSCAVAPHALGQSPPKRKTKPEQR